MKQKWPNEQPIDEWDREIFEDAQHWPLYRRSVALIGSYHAPFLDEMRRAASVFRDHDITVVHPTNFIPRDQSADFVVYQYDPQVPDERLQQEADDRMVLSTAVLVICPGGRLGEDTKREVQYLAGNFGEEDGGGISLYFTAKPRPTREQMESTSFHKEDWGFIQDLAEGRVVDPQTLTYRILGGTVTRLVIRGDTIDYGVTSQRIHIADDLFGED